MEKPQAPKKVGQDVFQNLGPTLALCRDFSQLSQAELARKAGIGKGQLSKYESGRELPKLETLARLLAALYLSPSTFFNAMKSVRRLETWEEVLTRDLITFASVADGPDLVAVLEDSPGLTVFVKRFGDRWRPVGIRLDWGYTKAEASS